MEGLQLLWYQRLFIICLVVVQGLADITYKCPLGLSTSQYTKIFGQNCYQFIVFQKKDFSDAQSYCQYNGGGNLALVKSKEINNFISDTLENTYDVHSSPVWIGLQYSVTDDDYRWLDGSSLGKYHNLKEGQSYSVENCVAIVPRSILWREYECDTKWYHYGSSKRMFVCEYPAVPSTTTTTTATTSTPITSPTPRTITIADCPKDMNRDGYVQVFGNICYMFEMKLLRTFSEAQKFCQNLKGGLVTIHSAEVDNFIQTTFYQTYGLRHPAWIGLRYNPDYLFSPDSQTHVWVDGSSMLYSNFHDHTFNPSYECVAIDPNDGKWLFKDCQTNYLPLVCELQPMARQTPEFTINPTTIHTTTTVKHTTTTTTTDITTSPTVTTTPTQTQITVEDCPVTVDNDRDIQVFGNKCYFFGLNYESTFRDAEDFCESFEGTLALVKSEDINSFLRHHLTQTHKKHFVFDRYWIGLEYNSSYHGYYWVDGTPLKFHQLRNQKAGECVTLNAVSDQWEEDICHNDERSWDDDQTKLGFICEFTATPRSATTTMATDPATITTRKEEPPSTISPSTTTTIMTTTIPTRITVEDCPVTVDNDKDIQVFGNKCYYFGLNYEKTYQDAEKFCEDFDGTLALVKSEDVNSFLQYHLTHTHNKHSAYNRYWIGLEYSLGFLGGWGYEWVDGSQMTFHKFKRSFDESKGCLTLNAVTGQWEEDICHEQVQTVFDNRAKLGFICEFTATPKEHTSTTTVMTTIVNTPTTTTTTTTSTTTTNRPTTSTTTTPNTTTSTTTNTSTSTIATTPTPTTTNTSTIATTITPTTTNASTSATATTITPITTNESTSTTATTTKPTTTNESTSTTATTITPTTTNASIDTNNTNAAPTSYRPTTTTKQTSTPASLTRPPTTTPTAATPTTTATPIESTTANFTTITSTTATIASTNNTTTSSDATTWYIVITNTPTPNTTTPETTISRTLTTINTTNPTTTTTPGPTINITPTATNTNNH